MTGDSDQALNVMIFLYHQSLMKIISMGCLKRNWNNGINLYYENACLHLILGTPVVIYTDILLRSMGPISEKDMVSNFFYIYIKKKYAHYEKFANCELID